jgi:hypothetical protein
MHGDKIFYFSHPCLGGLSSCDKILYHNLNATCIEVINFFEGFLT